MRTYSVTWNHILSSVHACVNICAYSTRHPPTCVRERILSHENTFCHKRTHSVTWEPILSHENTFCHMRTFSVTWEHLLSWEHHLSHENTLYHMRTHSIIRGRRSMKIVSVWHENMFCQIRIWFIQWEHLLSDQETFCCMSVFEAVSTTKTHRHRLIHIETETQRHRMMGWHRTRSWCVDTTSNTLIQQSTT